MLLMDKAKETVMFECVYAGLTLPPATTDFPEAGSLTQPVEPLLFDQLHDLWLDLLPKLPSEKKTGSQFKRNIQIL